MGKSDLKSFLEASTTDAVALSFRQVEILLGERLPQAARNPAWWAERPDENALASAWADAGFQPESVDVDRESVVFGKHAQVRKLVPGTEVPGGDPDLFYTDEIRHPLFGALRGKIWVDPNYDLTQPLIDEAWLKEKYGD